MLTFTEAQVLAWISPVLWPFLRVLALFSSMISTSGTSHEPGAWAVNCWF